MKKIGLFVTLFVILLNTTNAQETILPLAKAENTKYVLSKVILYPDATIVYINIPEGDWWYGSPYTYIEYSPTGDFFANKKLKVKELIGYCVDDPEPIKLTLGKSYSNVETIVLLFPAIPKGISTIHIEDEAIRGLKFWSIQITARNDANIEQVATNENDIKALVDSSTISIAGFYEILSSANGNNYKLALIERNNQLLLVYLGRTDGGECRSWKYGEVKAVLRPTAIEYFYKADWYTLNKQVISANITFEETGMTVNTIDGNDLYIRMGNKVDVIGKSEKWSGTCWALGKGYVVTNYHVAENAKTITITGVKGDHEKGYSATVVATDKINDLAVLRITDSSFTGYGNVPYGISTRMADKGETIFVMGYPYTQILGDEVKYTTGEINSRTGYQGEVNTYQISAQVDHGSSGGPMFDSNGNVIGIIVGGTRITENANYAIKTSYLKVLVESAGINVPFLTNNAISTLSTPEKVKRIENFVFYIECSK